MANRPDTESQRAAVDPDLEPRGIDSLPNRAVAADDFHALQDMLRTVEINHLCPSKSTHLVRSPDGATEDKSSISLPISTGLVR